MNKQTLLFFLLQAIDWPACLSETFARPFSLKRTRIAETIIEMLVLLQGKILEDISPFAMFEHWLSFQRKSDD